MEITDPDVLCLDLSDPFNHLVDDCRWPPTVIQQADYEYRLFLEQLRRIQQRRFRGRVLAVVNLQNPTGLAQLFWSAHTRFARNYTQTCKRLFRGLVLVHTPAIESLRVNDPRRATDRPVLNQIVLKKSPLRNGFGRVRVADLD